MTTLTILCLAAVLLYFVGGPLWSWHTVAYTGSIGNTANTDLPAASDDILTIFNSHFLLRKQMGLVCAYALGAQLTRARFDSPTLRFYGNPFIRPVSTNAHIAANDNFDFDFGFPMLMPPGEEIAIQVTNAAAGPTRTQAFLCLMEALERTPPGNIYTVRFTSTTTANTNAWTTLTYTMDQALPTGGYAMVFSELQHTNAMFHRWIFDEQVYRPGLPSTVSEANRTPNYLQAMPWGIMGRFVNTSLPRLQVFTDTADASYVGYMYVIPLGRDITNIEPKGQPYLAPQPAMPALSGTGPLYKYPT